MDAPSDLRFLFHQLNNELGIILAHAELLESKAADEASRGRATQIVTTTVAALSTVRTIRQTVVPDSGS